MMISTVTCSILAVVFDAPSHHFNVQKLLQWGNFHGGAFCCFYRPVNCSSL